jgi:ABC-type transport system substrate-binding protein
MLSACLPYSDTPAMAVETLAAASAQAVVSHQTLPAEGGEMKIPMPINPVINPLKTQNMLMANIYKLIFESLVTIDLDGRAQPCLAETWEVAEDQKTWTFHLRKGIQWHGSSDKFDADDVVFTLETLKNIGSADTIYAKCNDIISSYEAVDENTLKIVTDKARSSLPYSMVFPVLHKGYYENASDLDTKSPVGTGPYKVQKMQENGLTLVVNDKWWKTKPYIKTIQAVPVEDNEVELAGYQIGNMNYVTTAALTSGKYRQTGKTEVADFMTQYYDCLMPNIKNTIFSDPNVRKALAYSIDKGDIISSALLNHAVAADFPVPPDSWLYDGKLKIYEYNTAKAKDLLQASGWKDLNGDGYYEKEENGKLKQLSCDLLVLKTTDITYKIDVAKLIKEQLENMGFKINEIDQKEWDVYKTRLENRNYDLALCSFYMDRNPDLAYMLASDGAENYSGYVSDKMNQLLSKCSSAVKEDDLKKEYSNLQQAFVDDLPHIALYFRTNSVIYDSKIQVLGKVRELDIYHDISKWYMETKKVD